MPEWHFDPEHMLLIHESGYTVMLENCRSRERIGLEIQGIASRRWCSYKALGEFYTILGTLIERGEELDLAQMQARIVSRLGGPRA